MPGLVQREPWTRERSLFSTVVLSKEVKVPFDNSVCTEEK